MPRILIAGFGYVGEAAANLFHESGWSVQGWTRTQESAAKLVHKPYPIVAVDLSHARAIGARSENFDAVIHCASTRGGDAELYRRVYLEGACNLINRFVGSTILFTSSTSVYAQSDGSWVTEVSETSPIRETGRILLEAENRVLGGGGIVARVAGIYGPARSALLEKVLAGDATIDPLRDRFVNQVHRDDIATAFFVLINQGLAREVYNVVDDKPILQSECYRWLAGKLGYSIPPVAASPVPRKRGVSNKRVSNAKLRGLGWSPLYPTFADGMERSVLLDRVHAERPA
jgi:nucleoside-diphosphate-sugar epimerase